ncbi:ISL3 family transposase [Phaeodactylibacter luteus]|uniref:ISL3 family transposase n=1 Tax=Phaeodactylibacter luteus TaxID=1564516 RepID=A0A5C6RN72_9BACT|nr:ISL3 family transposase [Phaeodactylibacter luteus]TXB63801.1 ISL3 family transposase [Phaeodactylibacter luteus]
MKNKELFAMALGINTPWFIQKIEFTESELNDSRELHLFLDFKPGSAFKVSDGDKYTAYDTRDKTWRHLDFFQHRCYLHAKVPRVKKSDGKVEQVEVPWARPGSGFTLLFESFVLQLIECEMPVSKVGQLVGEYANRIWTILNYYVRGAYQREDHSQVKELGIDETSTKKGHNYITVAVDMDERKVVHVTPGKDKQSVSNIQQYLESKGCKAEQIEEVSLDMSPSFISGSLESFPNAALTFDRFHVKKLLNKAMDKVRQAERKEHELLKGHKYTFLKGEEKLSKSQKEKRDSLLKLYPTLGEAYRLKVLFDDFWEIKEEGQAELFLADWCSQAEESKIFPFIEFVKTLKAHWYGIMSFTTSRLTNGILEGINTKIQLAKRRARGYRNLNNFITMIYLLAGKLDLKYPHKSA